MRTQPFVHLVVAAAVLGSCSADSPTFGDEVRSTKARVLAPDVPKQDAADLRAGNQSFAIELHQALAAGSQNVVTSPASISLALAMLYGGARGTTAAEMATALGFTLTPERLHPAFDELDLALAAPVNGDFRLTIANKSWGQAGAAFLPEYLDLLATFYGAGMRLVDFAGDAGAAVRDINGWVSRETDGNVPRLLEPGDVDGQTRLVLTNAVSFRASWMAPFKQSTEGVFHAASGDVAIQMMIPDSPVTPIWRATGYEAASLSYLGDIASMIVVVPDMGTFEHFEQNLTRDRLREIFDGTSGASTGGVAMPRFRFGTSVNLVPILTSLGMVQAFTANADLSGISGMRDLHVTATVHQATIAIDEKGTEATAGTGVVVGTRSASPVDLTVNRPFLFFIRHDATGAILFQGRVLDPSK